MGRYAKDYDPGLRGGGSFIGPRTAKLALFVYLILGAIFLVPLALFFVWFFGL